MIYLEYGQRSLIKHCEWKGATMEPLIGRLNDLNDIYAQLCRLRKDTKAFDTLAEKFKKDFIENAPAARRPALCRMQNDIDRELAQCKTSEERMMVIRDRFKILCEYAQSVRDGTASICVLFPEIWTLSDTD